MKRVRIVSYRGKTTLRWEFLREDGDMENISLDSVDVMAKDPKEFMILLDAISEARKLPIINVNSLNREIYFDLNLDRE